MKLSILEEYEGRKVKIILNNNFVYSGIVFSITNEGLIKFTDRFNETLIIEPEYIMSIMEVNNLK